MHYTFPYVIFFLIPNFWFLDSFQTYFSLDKVTGHTYWILSLKYPELPRIYSVFLLNLQPTLLFQDHTEPSCTYRCYVEWRSCRFCGVYAMHLHIINDWLKILKSKSDVISSFTILQTWRVYCWWSQSKTTRGIYCLDLKKKRIIYLVNLHGCMVNGRSKISKSKGNTIFFCFRFFKFVGYVPNWRLNDEMCLRFGIKEKIRICKSTYTFTCLNRTSQNFLMQKALPLKISNRKPFFLKVLKSGGYFSIEAK